MSMMEFIYPMTNEIIKDLNKAYSQLKEVLKIYPAEEMTLVLDFEKVTLSLSYGIVGAELNRLIREYGIKDIKIKNCMEIDELAMRPTIKLLVERGVVVIC